MASSKRSERLNFTLTPLERHYFERTSKALGMDLSAMIRYSVREVSTGLGFHWGPNPADPTSCPHCGIAKECAHVTGCPNRGTTHASTLIVSTGTPVSICSDCVAVAQELLAARDEGAE
jgi:hypothetical protein